MLGMKGRLPHGLQQDLAVLSRPCMVGYELQFDERHEHCARMHAHHFNARTRQSICCLNLVCL